MAPVAVSAGAATAAMGTEEYWRAKRQQAENEQTRSNSQKMRDEEDLSSPAITESTAPTSVSGGELTKEHAVMTAAAPDANSALAVATAGLPNTTTVSSPGGTAYDIDPVTGKPNAQPTGGVFPLLRHDADVSASNLHIPGEFPRH